MTEVATFAAGCFWGVEDAFRKLPGVVDVRVGYAGGSVPNPSYEQVCTGHTGHAEAAQVTFDPSRISYDRLLEAFWNIHDPTQVNRQGPDVGSQYRSVIFTHSPDQHAAAEASKRTLGSASRFAAPIATMIEPMHSFYEAEEYHQRYFEKHPGSASCHF